MGLVLPHLLTDQHLFKPNSVQQDTSFSLKSAQMFGDYCPYKGPCQSGCSVISNPESHSFTALHFETFSNVFLTSY